MVHHSMTFDAIAEDEPGPKWAARCLRSGPAYEAWFRARGGEAGPSRGEGEAALREYMPELAPVHRRLTRLAGDSDLVARFLSTWCPPRYLGGCSLAARAEQGEVRLVRNYDLSPELNEGLLLRTEWTGTAVMGMVEFLWGLSDGINAAGLSVALAYGGRSQVGRGFGVTTIVRYLLETCRTVAEALAVLKRVPSHMAYNLTLADRQGTTATVELLPGGGARVLRPAIATNHQHGRECAEHPDFTQTYERRDHLKRLLENGIAPAALGDVFLDTPLYQRRYAEGFGTLFTAVYDPRRCSLVLRWPGREWSQSLDEFFEERQVISYSAIAAEPDLSPWSSSFDLLGIFMAIRPYVSPAVACELECWAKDPQPRTPDWSRFADAFHPGETRC